MKALLCHEHGPANLLRSADIEPPAMVPGGVRIRVHAAGVNFPDTLIIQGKYQFQPPLPFAPGGEVAGVVTEVAEGVTRFEVGDRVMGLCGWGGFAEEVIVPAQKCIGVPEGMSLEAASAFGMTYGTSMYALVQRGKLQPGETLLVHGASGGVGAAAVEIGKSLGAKVIATTGRAEKVARLQEAFDLEHVIHLEDGVPLKAAVAKITGGGVDVICDPVGGEVFEQSLRCLNWNGRILVVGFASGTIPAAKANLMLLKGSAVVGVFWGAFATKEPAANHKNFAQLLSWAQEGKLRPRISHRFALEDGAQALEALLAREVVGNAVLNVRDDV